MSDNVSSIFERYGKPVSRLQKPEGNGQEIYRPFDLEPNGVPAHRLRVDYSNGDVNMFLYGNMISVYASQGGISLIFSSGVVDIEGDQVYGLLDELHSERIRTLRAYDPKKHMLDNNSTIVIRQMTFQDVDEVLGRK